MTPPGAAGIAVLRLVGPGVEPFLRQRFSKPVQVGRCVHGELRDGDRVIDDPVVVLCRADVADVNLHGGVWVVRAAIELAKRDGFEVVAAVDDVSPVEAVDAQTVVERDVLRWLPRATTDLAVRALLAQPAAWEQMLARAARSEVGPEQIDRIIGDQSLHWLLSQPRVAIVGSPNVGKSTLANQLFGQVRSITADVAGTTRDWIGEVANIDGLAVMLLDTPGRRETADPIERAAIEVSADEISAADLVVIVLDHSAELGGVEQALLTAHPTAIVVANKSDLPHRWHTSDVGAIETVASDARGVDQLRRAILRHFSCDDLSLDVPRWWTAEQRQLLRRAVDDPALLAEMAA
ncbi:MAG TPA: GTPase [Tepidisphaeraceae bacterium]|nr:GTPase [Tepidisphaeraceae bacterium]